MWYLFFGFYKGLYIKTIYTGTVASFLGKDFAPLFNKFQKDSDSLIFSSLIYNKQYSFNDGVMVSLRDSPDNIILSYKNDEVPAVGNFRDYTSQTGLQTMIYVFLDKILPFSPHVKAEIFYGMNALFSAIAVAAIIIWFSKITGWITGIGLTIYIAVFDIWIILFSKSVYWVMWTWFLPMIISIIMIEKYIRKQKYSKLAASVFICLAIIFKCLCGFEYITAIIITMTVPYFYYWISLRWEFKDFIKKLSIVLLASLAGFAISLGIWVTQYSIHFQSLSKALDRLSITVFKRIPGAIDIADRLKSAGFNPDYIEIIRKSLEVPALRVAWIYMTKPFGPFRYGYAVLIILLFTLAGVIIFRKFKIPDAVKRNIKGLLVSTWISFIAPLSWYILAKGHSFIHTHINFALWDVPFIFFSIVLSIYIMFVLIAYNSKSNRLRLYESK